MIYVNGNPLEIYDIDNSITIRERIANRLGTIPKYLYFPEEVKYEENERIKVENILEEILKTLMVNY